MDFSGRGFMGSMPPVVKNLIIINVVMLIATWVAQTTFRTDLNSILGVYYVGSDNFEPYQIITHMFMHGGLTHLFFNMFALWMFGRVLEQVWGPKRFFIYYFVTGVGAAIVHTAVNFIAISALKSHMTAEQVSMVLKDGYSLWAQGKTFADPQMAKLCEFLNVPTVGASGAVFGVLLAFGMLFPNTQLMLLIPPMPIKAKWMVIAYGAIELFLGLTQPGSNIAHFAHLGGMIFGFFLIRYWRTRKDIFY